MEKEEGEKQGEGSEAVPIDTSGTGAARSTVREWLAGRSAPSGSRAERLAELSSIVERLTHVIRPTYIPVWLNKPIELLGEDKPIERIAAGDYRSVAQLISGLEDPGAV